MELLAPAGSYEALVAAVQSGADAVYVGGSRFSARGSAQNFSDEELDKWIKYCHLYGVEVHIAANTLIKENETEETYRPASGHGAGIRPCRLRRKLQGRRHHGQRCHGPCRHGKRRR